MISIPMLINDKEGSVHRFKVHRSAPPLTAEVASLIKKVTLALRSHIRGLYNSVPPRRDYVLLI